VAKRGFLGADAALAFAITGLLLAVPAALLPWVTLGTLGTQRATSLGGAVEGLWHYGMRALAGWVFICGTLAPVLLLALLTAVLLRAKLRRQPPGGGFLERAANFVDNWAMPEVQVLGVLVAFFKLGDVVNVTVGPGLWFYGAMSMAAIIAWRGFSIPWLGGAPRRAHARAEAQP
jgi:paraquat-inducible protein A